MPASKAPTHIHSYKRKRVNRSSKNPTYFCTLPGCFHKVEREVLFGKIALCPECGEKFRLDYEALRRAVPKCPKCRNDKTGVALNAAEDLIASLNLVGDSEDSND